MEKKPGKSENASAKTDKKKKAASLRRPRRSIHETFEWGFVSGGEDSDFNDSKQKKNVDKTTAKEKKQTKKSVAKAAAPKTSDRKTSERPNDSKSGKEHKSSNSVTGTAKSESDKKPPSKASSTKAQAAKQAPKPAPKKQEKAKKPQTAELFPWEESDDDLVLPSYGRTSLATAPVLPTESAEPPQTAPEPSPEKKKKKKEFAKSETKTTESKTVDAKQVDAKQADKKGKPQSEPAPAKKASVPSLFDAEPSESDAPKKKSKNRKKTEWVCSTIPPLPQRKRQRWDPEKREYVYDEEPTPSETSKATLPDETGTVKQKEAEKPEKAKAKKKRDEKPQPLLEPQEVEKKSETKKPRPVEPAVIKTATKEPVLKEPAVKKPEIKEQKPQPVKSKPAKDKETPKIPRGIVPEIPVSAKADPADVETTPEGFKKLPLSETMIEALSVVRYLEPTPIQEGVIQHVIEGVDVLGQAQTGTGKTAAFLIPIIEGIEECEPGNAPVALILVPTRELAVQVRDEALKLSYGRDIRVVACYGGKPIAKNIVRLREGVDILVGTPGRLLDLMKRGVLSCSALRWTVLDEADRMLDIGFRPDIEKILAKTPSDRQTLLFSATLPPQVVKLAQKYMNDPMILDFSSSAVAVETIEQYYITVDYMRKFDALVQLLKQEEPNQAIIFCRTKRGADRVGRMLESHFSSIAAIHGDLAQPVRDRVMSQFRAGTLRYLVATDVVGRGIDVSGISHIINYDIPTFCDDYVHRVGRTGRMGREGVAFTFVTAEEGAELTRIEMRIDRLLKRAELENFEAFSKPTDSTITDPFGPAQGKPVFGKSVRKVRRAL